MSITILLLVLSWLVWGAPQESRVGPFTPLVLESPVIACKKEAYVQEIVKSKFTISDKAALRTLKQLVAEHGPLACSSFIAAPLEYATLGDPYKIGDCIVQILILRIPVTGERVYAWFAVTTSKDA